MAKHLDLTGSTFGRLTVIGPQPTESGKRKTWNCICSCGTMKEVQTDKLKSGNTQSCGCLSREISSARGKKNATHGMSKTPEYKIWCGMRDRCQKETDSSYVDYGARGIEVSPQWKSSFENFYADMGPRPSPEHSIDRQDNDGNYEPGNCRWATPEEQASNKRSNDKHHFNGKIMTLSQISRETGIPQPTLWSRLNRMGLTIEEAVSWENYQHKKSLQ